MPWVQLLWTDVGSSNDPLPVPIRSCSICNCRLVGKSSLRLGYEPTMGGEDFAFFGQAGIPSAFVFLGSMDEVSTCDYRE